MHGMESWWRNNYSSHWQVFLKKEKKTIYFIIMIIMDFPPNFVGMNTILEMTKDFDVITEYPINVDEAGEGW